MGIRKQPFGYQISFGEIAINRPEADTVRWIFEQYAKGLSYGKLVSALAACGIPYYEGKAWNKNMVARILANKLYIGTGEYPTIVDTDLFRSVTVKRPSCGKLHEENSDVKIIRPLVRCAVCNGHLERKRGKAGARYWNCSACGGTSHATTSALTAATLSLLNGLVQAPARLHPPELPPNTEKSGRLCAELDTEMKAAAVNFDGGKAKSLVFSLTAARFEELGAADYETRRLGGLLKNRLPSKELDTTLLREITAALLVDTDGKVSLKLKNGQLIGKETLA